jgi:hypothetical protein
MTAEEEKARIIKECMNNALYNGCGSRMMIAVFVFVVLLMSSCATRTQIEYRDRIVDHYITKVEKDTVIEKMHDSVYVHSKGDTVWYEKWHTKYVDKIVLRHDTCWRDSIVTVRKETTKKVVKIPKIFKISFVFSILVIIFAIYKVLKWLKVW